MKNITKIAGKAGARLCDRSRSVKLRVLDIARAARAKGEPHQQKLKRAYGQLLNSTSRVVGQAKRFSKEIVEGVKRSRNVLQRLALDGLRREIDTMVALVKQVMNQLEAVFRALPHDIAVAGTLDSVSAGDALDIKVAVDLLSRVARVHALAGRALLGRELAEPGEGDGVARLEGVSHRRNERVDCGARVALAEAALRGHLVDELLLGHVLSSCRLPVVSAHEPNSESRTAQPCGCRRT